MRLIDADALDNIVLRLNEEGRTITRSEYKTLDSIIFEFPTIEAELVRRGRWSWDDDSYFCSECQRRIYDAELSIFEGTYNYCPYCGARMEDCQ